MPRERPSIRGRQAAGNGWRRFEEAVRRSKRFSLSLTARLLSSLPRPGGELL